MDQLSKELLLKILTYFSNSDKVEWMCLNRYWYQILVDDCKFYQSVKLNDNNALEVFNLFENKQHLGQQVEVLDTVGTWDLYTIVSLPKLFPNLKILECCGSVYSLQADTVNIKLQQRIFKQWNQLEKISIKQKLFGSILLGSTIFSNLTEISLGVSYYADREEDHNSAIKDFFRALNNCPSLKCLTIVGYDAKVGLKDMELLHNNAPNLETLDLRCICLYPFDTRVQKTIFHEAGNLVYGVSGKFFGIDWSYQCQVL